jgi:predicted RNase H-like HicB family nuclease
MIKRKVSFTSDVVVCIEKDRDGYHAFCPAFKGLHESGDTVTEALRNINLGVKLYVASLKKHGEPIPTE